MILTGKALEGFRKYISYNHGIDLNDWEMGKAVFRNALIIEWFDSVGMLIGVYPNIYGKYVWHLNKSETYKRWSKDMSYGNRVKATNEAIEKSNEIYNSKNIES